MADMKPAKDAALTIRVADGLPGENFYRLERQADGSYRIEQLGYPVNGSTTQHRFGEPGWQALMDGPPPKSPSPYQPIFSGSDIRIYEVDVADLENPADAQALSAKLAELLARYRSALQSAAQAGTEGAAKALEELRAMTTGPAATASATKVMVITFKPDAQAWPELTPTKGDPAKPRGVTGDAFEKVAVRVPRTPGANAAMVLPKGVPIPTDLLQSIANITVAAASQFGNTQEAERHFGGKCQTLPAETPKWIKDVCPAHFGNRTLPGGARLNGDMTFTAANAGEAREAIRTIIKGMASDELLRQQALARAKAAQEGNSEGRPIMSFITIG